MKKWTQQDLVQIKNIIIALRKAKYEVQGEEILAFSQAVRWISLLHEEVDKDLKPSTSPLATIAKVSQIPEKSQSKSSKKNKR